MSLQALAQPAHRNLNLARTGEKKAAAQVYASRLLRQASYCLHGIL